MILVIQELYKIFIINEQTISVIRLSILFIFFKKQRLSNSVKIMYFINKSSTLKMHYFIILN